jgi:hypothetical protein
MGNETRKVINERQDLRPILGGQSLAKALAVNPDLVNTKLTFEMGWANEGLELSFLTEGQGNMEAITNPEGDYVWDVMGARVLTTQLISANSLSGNVGQGGSQFKLIFKDNFFIIDHTAISPSGVQCKIIGNPVPATGGGYEVTMKMYSGGVHKFIPAADLVVGKSWGQGIAIVPNALSKGNASHHQLPGRKTNKISWYRKSYNIEGNLANMAMKNINFSTPSGKPCKLMIEFAEWQYTVEWKQYLEEDMFYSEYNKMPDGSMPDIDPETGYPIPRGAGFDQIFREANFDSYGSTLTLNKLFNVIDGLTYADNSRPNNNTIIIFTGALGMQKIDEAIKSEVSANGMLANLDEKFVREQTGGLVFGANFRSFKTPQDNTIVIKRLGILDYGTRAVLQKENGEVDVTGKPIMSGDMYFMRATDGNGKPNIKMYYEKGRMHIRGIEKGMGAVPASWNYKGNDETVVTDQDKSSLHLLASKGINIPEDKYCMKMQYMP